MGNTGILELTLLAVDAEPAEDPETFISFMRAGDNQEIGSSKQSFPPTRAFKLPAFPQEKAIACVITPARYRRREVGIFTLTDGETIRRQPTVFRTPDRWQADFVKWSDLADAFDTLLAVLDDSPAVQVIDGKLLGKFVKETYDAVDPADRRTVNGKACLLNLFAKLNTLKEPVFGRKPWFGFVEQILQIGQERIIGLVDSDMLERVREIRNKIDRFEEYKRTPSGDHSKNIPSGFTFKKSDIISIKTKEDHGNLQLIVTPAKDADGADVMLLDADIDENGKLMAHLGDLFKHKFNGGTHPFDIHEYLILEDHDRPLGYELV